jgi:anti-sigma regulatory factor (Ser/Thr protein kinase)
VITNTLHPPRAPGEAVAHFDMEAEPDAPYLARRLTNLFLCSRRLWPESIETAQLLVSELVTNSVSADCEHVSLTLRHLPGYVTVEVFDGDGRPPLLAEASAEDESGRGLMLVQALSKEWGYFLVPSGGKVVFCVVSA